MTSSSDAKGTHPTYATATRTNWSVWFNEKDVSSIQAALENAQSWSKFLEPSTLPDDANEHDVRVYRRRHRLVFRVRTILYDRVVDLLHARRNGPPYYLLREGSDEEEAEADVDEKTEADGAAKMEVDEDMDDYDNEDKMDVSIGSPGMLGSGAASKSSTAGVANHSAAASLARQNFRHLDEMYYSLELDADDFVDHRRKELGEPEVDEFSDGSSVSSDNGESRDTTPAPTSRRGASSSSPAKVKSTRSGRKPPPRRSTRHTAGETKEESEEEKQQAPVSTRKARGNRGAAATATTHAASNSSAGTGTGGGNELGTLSADDQALRQRRRARQAQYSVFLHMVEGKEVRKTYVPLPGHTDLDRLNFYIDRVIGEVRAYEEHSFPFHRSVKKSEAPDYYEVISNPIDLAMMAKKMRSNEYLSKRQVEDDFALMFHNCRKYNQVPGNPYLTHATKTEQLANALLVEVPNIVVDPSLVPRPAADEPKGPKKKKKKGAKGRARVGLLGALKVGDDDAASIVVSETVVGSEAGKSDLSLQTAGVTRAQAAAMAAERVKEEQNHDLEGLLDGEGGHGSGVMAQIDHLEDTRDRYSDLHERDYRRHTASLRIRRLNYRRKQMALPFVDQDAFQRSADAMAASSALIAPHEDMPVITSGTRVLGPTNDVLSAAALAKQHVGMGLRKDSHVDPVAAGREVAAATEQPVEGTGETDSYQGSFPELFNPSDGILEMHVRNPLPGTQRYVVPFRPNPLSANLDRVSRIKELRSKIIRLRSERAADDNDTPMANGDDVEPEPETYPVFPQAGDENDEDETALVNPANNKFEPIARGTTSEICGKALETAILQTVCHAGFDAVSQRCVDIVRDVVSASMDKFGRVLQTINNSYAGKCPDEVLLAKALSHLDCDPQSLTAYVKEEVPHHGERLKDLEGRYEHHLKMSMEDPSWSASDNKAGSDAGSDISESDIGFLTGEFDGYELDLLGLGEMGIRTLVPASFLGPASRRGGRAGRATNRTTTRTTAQSTATATATTASTAAALATAALANGVGSGITVKPPEKPVYWIEPPPAWPAIDPMGQIEVVKGYLQKRAKDSGTGVVQEDPVRSHSEIMTLRRKQMSALREQAKLRREAQAAKDAAAAAAKLAKKKAVSGKGSTSGSSRKGSSSSKGKGSTAGGADTNNKTSGSSNSKKRKTAPSSSGTTATTGGTTKKAKR